MLNTVTSCWPRWPLVTDSDAVLAGPGDVDIYARMEDIREQLVETRARVEEKLDRLAR